MIDLVKFAIIIAIFYGKTAIQIWLKRFPQETIDFSDAIQMITKNYTIWSCNSQNLEA